MGKKKGSMGLSMSEVALFGILGGLTFAAKMVMAGFANIEPVSLMVMLMAVTFGRRAVYPIYVYVLMEFAMQGFGLWSVNYLYIWLVLAVAAWLLRGMTNPVGWAILSGMFGACFGALCAPVDLFIGGWSYAVTKWMSGIPFDIAHCVGNFAIALLLFAPLRKVLEELYRRMRRTRPEALPLSETPPEPPEKLDKLAEALPVPEADEEKTSKND